MSASVPSASSSSAPACGVLAGLAPDRVWRHFATLCAIPRASKNEAPLREHLLAWARSLGLEASVDAAGNLLLRKPASAGCEHAPAVVLQAHLDMVCQKNADSDHDFARDPIVPARRDGWLVAEETTLGADNGIGVALILAALEDPGLVHGPLEALLTVDEESGMSGAKGVAPGELRATRMLNLDTEEWGQFYLGCAGGLDVNVERTSAPQPLPAEHRVWRIALRGLRGGHSGSDIHEDRGNAIKLLVRVLRALERRAPLRLAALRGGTARNALPREAFADVALPADAAAGLDEFLAGQQRLLRAELRGIDEGLTLSSAPVAEMPVLPPEEQRIWLASLHAAPYGVRRMSHQIESVVETSNNLGVVEIDAGGGHCNFMVRSLRDEGSVELAEEIDSLFSLSASRVSVEGQYPGWEPNPDSRLLALCRSVFRREFEAESEVKVIHAGLECGIIGAKYPGMDIVSFGPTIRGAHAPGESLEIASVERCWRLLCAILERSARTASGARAN